ncbi:16S rRNA (uracil(1498)-N(3))-methyltransferase [Paenibacillus physcomitrellae]|uniref:Ribosomal RNA small subunit methyltransferase E n=1 Tax=Paenibacillus physcomitrellae TaxID=1619311 RepID=A0ABQ1FKS8_9BACL|nr:16S rRNA (uracil(1498)-N(3))-methyltransferase [Paenibacillus physcomitrellae]GGA20388.1 ribosomal RNA small subunit methyltransferase E [Paenibacillus physcomitrellae]
MQRYFIPPEQFGEQQVQVTGEDARHITKVMRGKPGDKFIVSDGQGRVVLAELSLLEPEGVTAVILETIEDTSEPRIKVDIAQSLPKGDKMETVIQKCTEIGAAAFVPFLSERTIVQYDERKEEKRIARWSKIAKEAAEQAHRSRIPDVGQPVKWKKLLELFDGYDLVCMCYEKELGEQLRDIVQPFAASLGPEVSSRVLVVVGPEGGFTEEEVAEAEAAGAKSVGLGRRILRTETAGMAALTCILYETGEMGGV